ncbi:MAG: DNA gyrase inhibitor YacG [Myxococcales bacterium]|nr:DNA gyrase inhibitor YacG [Myxococcales bacterium]
MGRCPICGRPAAPRSKNVSAPFCWARCKQVDLGRWLDEGYRIPISAAPDDEDAGPLRGDGPPPGDPFPAPYEAPEDKA